jgi:hypothetical protein
MAQPCKHRILNKVEGQVISEYRDMAIRENRFPNSMGVIKVIETKKENLEVLWRFSILLDDSYKDNPPKSYATFGEDVVFFYNDSLKTFIGNINETNDCLDSIVLDRLYIKPPKRERKMIMRYGNLVSDPPILGKNGEIRYIIGRRQSLDNSDYTMYALFKLDGMVNKSFFGIPK